VARLTKLAGIRAWIGCRRRPGKHCGKPPIVVSNTLERQVNVAAPDRVCLTVMQRIACW
jgi:putative transposase